MFYSYPCVNMLHLLMKKLYVSQLSMCQYVKCINEEVICFIAIHVSKRINFILVTNQCEDVRDVNVILEVPHTGRAEALKEANIFLEILASTASNNNNSCWRPHIRLADTELNVINTFDCYSLQCISDGLEEVASEVEETEL